MASLRDCRGNDGELLWLTWPGFYPMIYYDADHEPICPACATKHDHAKRRIKEIDLQLEKNKIKTALEKERKEQEQLLLYEDLIFGGVFEEGQTVQCRNCQKSIESSYGDPNAKEDVDVVHDADV